MNLVPSSITRSLKIVYAYLCTSRPAGLLQPEEITALCFNDGYVPVDVCVRPWGLVYF